MSETQRHVPLVTMEFSDDGEVAIVRVTCNACAGGTHPIPTAHLATLARTLVAICVKLDLDISSPATILDFGSEEERRAAEARYAEIINERRRAESERDGTDN